MSDEDNPTPEHPGIELKRLLAERDILQSDLAFVLGQSVKNVSEIVSLKRGVSPEMSKALGTALDLPLEHFADLQSKYDLFRASEPNPDISLRNNLVKSYPVREMIRRQWIQDGDANSLQSQLVNFFGVNNLTESPSLIYAAKKTHYGDEVNPSLMAWLFRARQIAKASGVATYSESKLRSTVERLREFLTKPEDARHVPRALAECGVRFVIVESLPKAKIDGACFWLDENSPVIAMSLRYDRIDNFWFVVRHEIEHVFRRDGVSELAVDTELEGDKAGTDDSIPEQERLANFAAANFCIPSAKIESFIMRKHPFYYERDVLAFAQLQKVHPGLVVGQMQRRLQRYNYLNRHQVKIRHSVIMSAMADGWGQTVPV